MKIVVIGDIHGKTIWYDILQKESDYDKVIFLGDYVDTHEDINAEQILSNLDNILTFKEENPDKVILLRGNHDQRYAFDIDWSCTGYNPTTDKEFPVSRFVKNTQWIYIYDNIIFSHAGITTEWMKWCHINSVDDINELPYGYFAFNGGSWDTYGTDSQQGPTWIRPMTLIDYMIPKYDQVVGHTPVKQISKLPCRDQSLILCDCLDKQQYVVIEDNQFNFKTYECKNKETEG